MEEKLNSFVENVNIVANATKAATGDIIEDAKIAANTAITAADRASISANKSEDSELMSREWAEKGFNNPITGNPNHFSSFHWSEVAKQHAGSVVIFDDNISLLQTWSSQKINDQLASKSNDTHTHEGVYEPVILKKSAFNKNFRGTGFEDTVARSDHHHQDTYEPKIASYGTAYNKDFGRSPGQVAEGNHNHDNDYMPKVTTNTAYNKNFGTTLDTVAQGNHTHGAQNIGYDKSNSVMITSTQVQGAIDQLDLKLGNLKVSENTFLTAGTTNTAEASIPGQNTYVDITAPLAVLSNKNANLTLGSSINVKYPVSPIDLTPEKMIEGNILITLSVSNPETIGLNISIDGAVYGTAVNGKGTITISKYLYNMSNNGFVITPIIANLENSNNIFITSMSITWNGVPQGALVLSGTTISHNDVTDRTDPDSHNIASITNLQTELDNRPLKAINIVDGNFTVMDTNGNLVDSGLALGFENNLVPKVSSAIHDNIPVLTSEGSLIDSGSKISDLALKNGDNSTQFKVGTATLPSHAVRFDTFNSAINSLTTQSDFDAFITRTDNPHSVTHTQVGAAPAVHTHTISDITGLHDQLNSKVNKVTSAAQNNIVIFGVSGEIIDSGVSVQGKRLIGEAI